MKSNSRSTHTHTNTSHSVNLNTHANRLRRFAARIYTHNRSLGIVINKNLSAKHRYDRTVSDIIGFHFEIVCIAEPSLSRSYRIDSQTNTLAQLLFGLSAAMRLHCHNNLLKPKLYFQVEKFPSRGTLAHRHTRVNILVH